MIGENCNVHSANDTSISCPGWDVFLFILYKFSSRCMHSARNTYTTLLFIYNNIISFLFHIHLHRVATHLVCRKSLDFIG